MGYLVVTAVLVVLFGRLGDMFGWVRICNLGLVVFTVAAIALSFDSFALDAGAVADRLAGDSGHRRRHADGVVRAILTDAFRPTSAAWRWAWTWSRRWRDRSSAC